MRIAMSSYRFNLQGGIERASLEVAQRIARLGEDVTLVASDVSPAVDGSLSWHRVPLRPGPGFLTPLRYPRAATRSIRTETFDIRHNQGGCALTGQEVITAHSCHRAWWEIKLRSGEAARALLNPRHRVVLAMERANYRPGAYRQVIAVSSGVAREVQEHYGVPDDRITVIPNGVEPADFQPVDAVRRRDEIRRRHGFDETDTVLLFVGKEFRRKGLTPLIESLPLLPRDVKVLVVGGDDARPYEAIAGRLGVRDRLVFAGHSTEVHDYFQAGDAFVFPSRYEAFALVMLEAASAGLPLLVTRVNGADDIVSDGVNGLFIERDGASIAAAVSTLLQNPGLRTTMGAQSRVRAAEFSWDAIARRTREVYRRAIETP